MFNKEYESFMRVGTQPFRPYYIPFLPEDRIKTKYGIVDRKSSSEFISLDGQWNIKEHTSLDNVEIDEEMTSEIPVPSCVQMHGYDQIQYLNTRYPIPFLFPQVPYENPCYHYRRVINIEKDDNKKYYLNFEGVDSAFYLFVNGNKKGYSQISHSISEFDITDMLKDGENTIDVVVLKWSISTYLECQDKFRFTGIFRSVYMLVRPQKHIEKYKIETKIDGTKGTLKFYNNSKIGLDIEIDRIHKSVTAHKSVTITIDNVKLWSADNPELYTLMIRSESEKICEKVGFREIKIEGKVFKINDKKVKLRGVNRHDFNTRTGATVTLKDIVTDLKLMKELNVNAVRTSHYPPLPEFIQLCDSMGIYVIDEADLETHGMAEIDDRRLKSWSEFFTDTQVIYGVTQRQESLVKRDMNRPSVIIWSQGNESSYEEALVEGAKVIRKLDKTRPIHYEGLQCADEKFYYTKNVDMVSMMYPSLEKIKDKVLDNPKEKRPFILCEYTHAMGNSCGDICDYWKLIDENEQMMGAFVWEWADHAIKGKKGFLYGGDFGEIEHDGNFCTDGLVTADRKVKSGAREMQAVYGGKRESLIKDIPIPTDEITQEQISIMVNEHTGEITRIKVGKEEILTYPIKFNITRYIDNERKFVRKWNEEYNLKGAKPHIYSYEKVDNTHKFIGCMASNCRKPILNFEIQYTIIGGGLKIEFGYKISEHIKNLARVGLELRLPEKYEKFSFIGYGKGESYIDKHIYTDYGYYESTAKENYDRNYVMPQESGSHYATKYTRIDNLLRITADKPYSFSYNNFTTAQLRDSKHDYELQDNDFKVLCLDNAMRGVGSHSCGPELRPEYEIPVEYKNTYYIEFLKSNSNK